MPINEDVLDLQKQLVSLHYVVARAKLFIMMNVEEVNNDCGGVIGYKLELNVPQTKYLMEILNERRD